MRAHILTIVNSRTRGLAPMMVGILNDEDRNHYMPAVTNLWKVKMERCIACKSGAARKSSLKPVTYQTKAKEEGKVKLTKNVSAVDAIGHTRADSRAETLRPKGKVSLNAKTKKQRPHKNLPLETIELGA